MWLVDVRSADEVGQGRIHSAVHIPLFLLPLRIHELSKQGPTVFFCRSGARSALACNLAHSHGMENVYNLSGGLTSLLQAGFTIQAQA